MSIMLAHDDAETAWPRRTRAEELRMRLADDIVRGRLAPGAALRAGMAIQSNRRIRFWTSATRPWMSDLKVMI
jgi:hypothetical protein